MTIEEILRDMWTILKRMQMPNFGSKDWEAYARLKAYFEKEEK